MRGERITLGDKKSFLLLNFEEGKVILVTEGNLRGVNLIRGDFSNFAMMS